LISTRRRALHSKSRIVQQLHNYDLIRVFKKASHPRERMRLLAFIHLQEGKGPLEVAQIIKVTRNTIHRWIRNFELKGIKGLREQGGRGKKPLISDRETETFRLAVVELQEKRKGGCITGHDVLKLMEEKYGIKCSLKSAYNQLKKASLVWISSRSKHPNADPKRQLEFKKNLKKT
jgi:transposase